MMRLTRRKPWHIFSLLTLSALLVLPLRLIAAQEQIATPNSPETNMRIVSLSPHLTELVFALGKGQQLVGVSDYSDYPVAALSLPRIASYQGVNIAALMRLKATHILAWQGGNKQSDISKLEALGFSVLSTAPKDIHALVDNISRIGDFIEASHAAQALRQAMQQQLTQIKALALPQKISAVYYMNDEPLSGAGADPWINSLLGLCNIENVYHDQLSSYIQISVADVLRRQAQLLIAATQPKKQIEQSVWAAHLDVYQPKWIAVNPDALHRFTPRVLPEVKRLCEQAAQ